MDSKALQLARGMVDPKFIDAAADALQAHRSSLTSLLAQRHMPEEGFSPPTIEAILSELALMDSNNFPSHAGAGEREGRVFSHIVAQRHRYMSHGVGRSGDLLADQPKAAGSSLMKALTNFMVKDALKQVGLHSVATAFVAPMATGLTLSLVLQSLRRSRPDTARFVIIPRIDQKTCVKCIVAAGMKPVIVPLRFVGSQSKKVSVTPKVNHSDPAAGGVASPPDDELFLQSHIADIERAIAEAGGPDGIVAVLSVTSCFAPRLPDDTLTIGRLCYKLGIPHLVNNAYGVQSPAICRRLEAALSEHQKTEALQKQSEHRKKKEVEGQDSDNPQSETKPSAVGCRVDAFVQSGDKNFLVPVGGSVIAGPNKEIVEAVAALYPGRASAAPTFDLFVTLLELGRRGWKTIRDERLQLLSSFQAKVKAFAEARGEVFLAHPGNDISFAMTLRNLPASKKPKLIGAELFRHCVSGARVIDPAPETTTTLGGVPLLSFGTHHNKSTTPMLVMACGIGMTEHDLTEYVKRLEVTYPI